MTTRYVALIGDAVASRRLARAARTQLQSGLRDSLQEVNRRWRRVIAARFAVTLGDQFQGLLTGAGALWEITHWLRVAVPQVDWVMAAGRGPIHTPLARGAPEGGGPRLPPARVAPAGAAGVLGIGRSAVSRLARRMAWRLVAAGDEAFRQRLSDL